MAVRRCGPHEPFASIGKNWATMPQDPVVNPWTVLQLAAAAVADVLIVNSSI